jgi:hypothetical protein
MVAVEQRCGASALNAVIEQRCGASDRRDHQPHPSGRDKLDPPWVGSPFYAEPTAPRVRYLRVHYAF